LDLVFAKCVNIGVSEIRMTAGLRSCSLPKTQIGEAGISAFTSALSSGALPQLHYLGLGDNQIGDAGLRVFAAALSSGALPQLEELYLGSNQISDAAAVSFHWIPRSARRSGATTLALAMSE